jgi:hypothetical protein
MPMLPCSDDSAKPEVALAARDLTSAATRFMAVTAGSFAEGSSSCWRCCKRARVLHWSRTFADGGQFATMRNAADRARSARMSRASFASRFRATVGQAPFEYSTSLRMDRTRYRRVGHVQWEGKNYRSLVLSKALSNT